MAEQSDNNVQSADAGVPDAAVVSLVDAVSHALDTTTATSAAARPVPLPLPVGWVMKESRSQPKYYYYYNMDTGISTWHSPAIPQQQEVDENQQQQQSLAGTDSNDSVDLVDSTQVDHAAVVAEALAETRKRSHAEAPGNAETTSTSTSSATTETKSKKSKSGKPSKVRILHILKKHKGSRRPSSWRQAKITSTKEEAVEELEGLVEILKEESGEAQRATFEELARTESDCSSAKRGGDLGFFGPKKMQPEFEKASFALEIGELSGIVETSSGVHVLLRIG